MCFVELMNKLCELASIDVFFTRADIFNQEFIDHAMDICHLVRADDLLMHIFETLKHIDNIPKLEPMQFVVARLDQRRHKLHNFCLHDILFSEQSNAVFDPLQHVIQMLAVQFLGLHILDITENFEICLSILSQIVFFYLSGKVGKRDGDVIGTPREVATQNLFPNRSIEGRETFVVQIQSENGFQKVVKLDGALLMI